MTGSAHAQGVRFSTQITQKSTIAGVANVVTVPAAPAVAFCNAPANAVPCTNKATTYTDATLATPCSTSTQIVLDGTTTCVASPDAQNNWGVWVAAGQYAYTVTVNGANFGAFYVTASASGGVAFTGSTTAGQLLYGGAAANQIASTPNDTWNQSTLIQTLLATASATGGANQSSPTDCFGANYWTGSASAPDTLCWQSVPNAGSNPSVALALTHSGSSGGYVVDMSNANFVKTGPLQIVNPGVASQLIQVGSSAGNSIQLPLTNPPNANMFLGVLSSGGNPNQTSWRNAAWSASDVDLTGQTTGTGTVTWASSNLIAGATQYRISWDAKVTTAAGTSSTLGPLTITYVDPDGTTQTITCAAQSKAGVIETSDAGNVTTTVLLGVPFLANSNNAANNFTYNFGYASNPANAMAYNLHLRLEVVQ